MTPKPGWHISNKLAETGNGFDDRVYIAIACLVAGISDKFARDALYLAHVQPSRHQPTAHAHDSARAGEQPATTFRTRGGNGLGRTRQTPEQGLHRVGRTFRCQEIEDDSHGSFRDWPVDTHITGDLVDELVHGLLVYLAPPARQKHIAHYICLDKAEQKFGGDVLQIDNAGAGGTLRRAAVSPLDSCAIGECIIKRGMFKMRCVRYT